MENRRISFNICMKLFYVSRETQLVPSVYTNVSRETFLGRGFGEEGDVSLLVSRQGVEFSVGVRKANFFNFIVYVQNFCREVGSFHRQSNPLGAEKGTRKTEE